MCGALWTWAVVAGAVWGVALGSGCSDGGMFWECGKGECCGLVEAGGRRVHLCVPCGKEKKKEKECKPLAAWKEDMEAWLPSPVKSKDLRSDGSEVRVCEGRLCATEGEDVGFGSMRCHYSEPELSWLVENVIECGEEAKCCAAYRKQAGRGPWLGLGCESCRVGVSQSMSFVLWRGGGGGRFLPRPWNSSAELCRWSTLPDCIQLQPGKRPKFQTCAEANDCCFVSRNGTSGCSACDPSIEAFDCNNGEGGLCFCRGHLCNRRLPPLTPV